MLMKMSACSEFAEHVWKPGSCKNCFHPRSAHSNSTGGRTGAGGVEDDGVTSVSPYSKPTIAVRPTMMNPDLSVTQKDVNMNSEQEKQKSMVDRLGLKKGLDLAPLYIDSNGYSKTLREAVLHIPRKMDPSSAFPPSTLSPVGFPKDSMIIGSIFVTQEDGRTPHGLKGSSNSDSFRQQMDKTVKSTYVGNGEPHPPQQYPSVQQVQAPLGFAINIIPAPTGNAISSISHEQSSTSPSPAVTPDSHHTSLSDTCSYRSSTDSLTGPDVFGTSNLEGSKCGSEPIYAESTKRKKKLPGEQKPQQSTELESSRATITVMAAHTEANNRTFYLSSPDSAVSTQWNHFSPTALKEPSSPAFKWPSSVVSMEAVSPASLQTKAQSSPPLPPKRNSRSPKLGASSLSPTFHPDLAFHSLSPRDAAIRSPLVESQSPDTAAALQERRHRLQNGPWNLEEVEEEQESEDEGHGSKAMNGTPVWTGSRDWSAAAQRKGSSATPGTVNNGASQKQAGTRAEERRGSVPAAGTSAAPLAHGTELAEAKGAAHQPSPPPPPPKKHHRPSAKMSQSSVDLDRASQQGSVENLGPGFTAASTDSLHTALSDSSGQDTAHPSCPSPFPRSPLASAPGSPNPDTVPNSLDKQPQPPPLPKKKLVNRTASAPGDAVGKVKVAGRPRLPFSSSESNVCQSEGAAPSLPSSPVEPRPLYSSSDSLENCHPPLGRPLRSRTLEDSSFRSVGRLGAHSRGSVTTASSPQLSAPAGNSALSIGVGTGSTLQLQTLLSNIDSREGIYSKLGGLYAESLRRLALKCEEHFTRSQRSPLRFDESNWSLFKLTCNKSTCQAGDAVYYAASCATDTNSNYAVKICRSQGADSKHGHLYGLSVQQNLPPHFNLQQDCGHFNACVPHSMLPSEETSESATNSGPGVLVSTPGHGGQERVVVITREVPHQSAADFVREWASFHRAQPEVYERRVCFLLLQLCNGLEHLKSHGVTHRDLCLENLLLVPHRKPGYLDSQQQQLPRLLISNFAKAKRRTPDEGSNSGPRHKRDHARLAPEIVSAAQYRKFDEFQAGILIYELLHQPNPFEVSPRLKEQDYRSEDLPSIPNMSIYSSGLQRLAQLLLQSDPIKRIHIQDAKRILQCLLWGPRRDLMEQQWEAQSPRGAQMQRHEGLLNWLDVKRALLMMKFAERSLEPERNAELEDWLCCQYFSAAHPLSLCHTAELLYSLSHTLRGRSVCE
ncbi:inactive tyrosine-protein kinase PRAG1 [Denticeps clupeoides]|uniref:Protein kinase domain-containing protein n=1 Tax=Denticeps clupeoides TaxID=299321 RepID=A0AAY4DSD1_9TELE|nr:inactive tyrosine-protein kinase PRAG1-like [Denticeps clupeoides]